MPPITGESLCAILYCLLALPTFVRSAAQAPCSNYFKEGEHSLCHLLQAYTDHFSEDQVVSAEGGLKIENITYPRKKSFRHSLIGYDEPLNPIPLGTSIYFFIFTVLSLGWYFNACTRLIHKNIHRELVLYPDIAKYPNLPLYWLQQTKREMALRREVRSTWAWIAKRYLLSPDDPLCHDIDMVMGKITWADFNLPRNTWSLINVVMKLNQLYFHVKIGSKSDGRKSFKILRDEDGTHAAHPLEAIPSELLPEGFHPDLDNLSDVHEDDQSTIIDEDFHPDILLIPDIIEEKQYIPFQPEKVRGHPHTKSKVKLDSKRQKAPSSYSKRKRHPSNKKSKTKYKSRGKPSHLSHPEDDDDDEYDTEKETKEDSEEESVIPLESGIKSSAAMEKYTEESLPKKVQKAQRVQKIPLKKAQVIRGNFNQRPKIIQPQQQKKPQLKHKHINADGFLSQRVPEDPFQVMQDEGDGVNLQPKQRKKKKSPKPQLKNTHSNVDGYSAQRPPEDPFPIMQNEGEEINLQPQQRKKKKPQSKHKKINADASLTQRPPEDPFPIMQDEGEEVNPQQEKKKKPKLRHQYVNADGSSAQRAPEDPFLVMQDEGEGQYSFELATPDGRPLREDDNWEVTFTEDKETGQVSVLLQRRNPPDMPNLAQLQVQVNITDNDTDNDTTTDTEEV